MRFRVRDGFSVHLLLTFSGGADVRHVVHAEGEEVDLDRADAWLHMARIEPICPDAKIACEDFLAEQHARLREAFEVQPQLFDAKPPEHRPVEAATVLPSRSPPSWHDEFLRHPYSCGGILLRVALAAIGDADNPGRHKAQVLKAAAKAVDDAIALLSLQDVRSAPQLVSKVLNPILLKEQKRLLPHFRSPKVGTDDAGNTFTIGEGFRLVSGGPDGFSIEAVPARMYCRGPNPDPIGARARALADLEVQRLASERRSDSKSKTVYRHARFFARKIFADLALTSGRAIARRDVEALFKAYARASVKGSYTSRRARLEPGKPGEFEAMLLRNEHEIVDATMDELKDLQRRSASGVPST